MCERFMVRGRVQGVGFRYATRDEARRLGVRGLARNLADGTVEVIACGEPNAVETLAAWLRHGPRFARVDGIERERVAPARYPGFEIG